MQMVFSLSLVGLLVTAQGLQSGCPPPSQQHPIPTLPPPQTQSPQTQSHYNQAQEAGIGNLVTGMPSLGMGCFPQPGMDMVVPGQGPPPMSPEMMSQAYQYPCEHLFILRGRRRGGGNDDFSL